MKKGLIITTTLAMALGVGVAVGAHRAEAKVAKAATVATVYCKVEQDWWKADGAAVGAYFWKGEEGQTPEVEPYGWPGTRMTAVQGQSDLWTVSVPANVEKVIFTRVNASGTIEYWGAQTKNLDIQSVKNCYTVTSESAVWGDPGVEGEWSVYPTVSPEYHVLGSFNDWNDPDDDYILTADAGDQNHYTFSNLTLAANDEVKVHDVKNDDWYGDHGNNVVVSEAGTYNVDFYVHADNEINVVLTKQVAYTITNRNGSPVAFVLDEAEKPEGVKHQYSAEIQYACRGGELKFYADGVQITEHIGVDAGDEEHVNNVYGNTTDGFRLRHTYDYSGYTKVYLKTYEDGGYSIWGDGYAVDFFSVTVKTNTTTAYNFVKDETFEPNETYIEQFKTTKAVPMKAMSGADWDTSNGIMCDGLAPDVAPEAVAGNNAMTAFQATAWKVHNDCEEVIYLKIKRTDLSIMMYIGGYEEAHVLTIGGKTVNLSDNGDGQYVAHGVALSAGDTVTSYTIEGVAQTVTSKKVANNNLGEDKKVIADVASADIYYNVENKTLWISGLPAAGQHLLKNGNTAIEMTHTEPFEDYDQYATGKLTFAANDTFKLVNTGADDSYPVIWCPETVVMSKELTGKFTYDSTNKEVKCVSACSAAVYLKIKSGVDEVYLGDVADYVDEAIDYANGFKSAMAGACSAEGKKAAVEAAWGAQATAYAALSAEAKAEVKLGGYSLVEEIQEFGERYIAIKQQHPDWNLDNFLEWDIPNNGAYRVVTSDAISENSTMIIIIAIAATSAIALGTLLIIKKRKHQ